MFFFILILSFILINNANVSAEVFFNLPENLTLEEVNKNIKNKTMNRSDSIEDQINNQYKGKLKYKSNNDAIRNYRKDRYYTSAFMVINKLSLNEIKNTNTNKIYEVNKGFKNSVGGIFGFYFRNNFSLEFEYFDYSNTTRAKENFFEDSKHKKFNSVDVNVKNYFINLIIENNYSQIIPFFGIGIGGVKTDFSNSEIAEETKIKSNLTPAYQGIAGIEFAVTNNVFINIKYKYYKLIKDSQMKVINKYNNNEKFDFSLNSQTLINIGFKYLW